MTPKAFNRTCFFKLQMVYLLLSSLTELLTILGEDSFSKIDDVGVKVGLWGCAMLQYYSHINGLGGSVICRSYPKWEYYSGSAFCNFN